MSLRFIDVACVKILMNNIPLYLDTTFCLNLLGCLNFFAIVNNAAKEKGVHICHQVPHTYSAAILDVSSKKIYMCPL